MLPHTSRRRRSGRTHRDGPHGGRTLRSRAGNDFWRATRNGMGRRRSPTRLQESRERRPARRAGLTQRTAAQRRREGPCRPAVTVRRRCGASHGGTEVTAARKSRRHGSHGGPKVTAARKSRRHGSRGGTAAASAGPPPWSGPPDSDRQGRPGVVVHGLTERPDWETCRALVPQGSAALATGGC